METQDVLVRVETFLKGGSPPDGVLHGQLSLLAPRPARPVEKTIWGSPAGKKRLAARLVKLIPAHKVYVEPFAGSAAVFFEKEPVATEVLGDADAEIAAAFKALKSLTDAELDALRRKNWVGRESTYRSLLKAHPRGKVEKLYRFLYLSHFSYGKLRGKSFNPNADGIEATTIKRIEKFRDRLRKVKVHHGHYADLVKQYDSKDTFFFLDPPYPGHNVEVGEDRFDEVEFRKVLDGIKGRFLVTYGTRGELDTKGFHVRKIRPPRSIRAMRGVGGPKTLPQLLIANYTIAAKRLGDDWALEEVEGVLDLDAGASIDLEHARALAIALDPAVGSPLMVLKSELARLESDAAERMTVIARELLPVADRLAPQLAGALPSLASAMKDALPDLEVLAKAQWTRAYINDLPDSAFLYIEPGGEKDESGKTVPRDLRRFPVRDQQGRLNVPHLRNATARIPQADAKGLTADKKRSLQEEARRLLEEAQAETTKAASSLAAVTEVLAKRIPILKTGEERYVLGIVLEPETVDAQRDIYSAPEVREAAHRFMADFQNVGLMHREVVTGRVKILESYVAPAGFELDGTTVKKGTWLLAVRVADDGLWQQIKTGQLTGFSIGGSAVRSEKADA
jgi:site-specific DNA-adenine methylase